MDLNLGLVLFYAKISLRYTIKFRPVNEGADLCEVCGIPADARNPKYNWDVCLQFRACSL